MLLLLLLLLLPVLGAVLVDVWRLERLRDLAVRLPLAGRDDLHVLGRLVRNDHGRRVRAKVVTSVIAVAVAVLGRHFRHADRLGPHCARSARLRLRRNGCDAGRYHVRYNGQTGRSGRNRRSHFGVLAAGHRRIQRRLVPVLLLLLGHGQDRRGRHVVHRPGCVHVRIKSGLHPAGRAVLLLVAWSVRGSEIRIIRIRLIGQQRQIRFVVAVAAQWTVAQLGPQSASTETRPDRRSVDDVHHRSRRGGVQLVHALGSERHFAGRFRHQPPPPVQTSESVMLVLMMLLLMLVLLLLLLVMMRMTPGDYQMFQPPEGCIFVTKVPLEIRRSVGRVLIRSDGLWLHFRGTSQPAQSDHLQVVHGRVSGEIVAGPLAGDVVQSSAGRRVDSDQRRAQSGGRNSVVTRCGCVPHVFDQIGRRRGGVTGTERRVLFGAVRGSREDGTGHVAHVSGASVGPHRMVMLMCSVVAVGVRMLAQFGRWGRRAARKIRPPHVGHRSVDGWQGAIPPQRSGRDGRRRRADVAAAVAARAVAIVRVVAVVVGRTVVVVVVVGRAVVALMVDVLLRMRCRRQIDARIVQIRQIVRFCSTKPKQVCR